MKSLLYTVGVATLAFALTAQGQQSITTDSNNKSKGRAEAQTSATSRSNSVRGGARVQTSSYSSNRVRTYRNTPMTTSRNNTSVGVNANARTRTYRDRNISSNQRVGTFRDRNISRNERVNVRNNNNVTVNRRNNMTVNRRNNVTVNRERNMALNRDRNVMVNRNRSVTVNNNWRGSQFAGRNYSAFRNYHRQWHDRGWWSSHFSTIVFVGGGWWYWDSGYWFPAWGYAPYAYYPYDGPIYTGYAGLGPDRVTIEVQSQLQRDGYYAGPIDGVLGPMTRQAIANFQADHGLAVTASVDEPTLDTLGIS